MWMRCKGHRCSEQVLLPISNGDFFATRQGVEEKHSGQPRYTILPPAPASHHPAAHNCCSCEIDHDPSPSAPRSQWQQDIGLVRLRISTEHRRRRWRTNITEEQQGSHRSPSLHLHPSRRVRPMQIGSEVGNRRDCASLPVEFSLQVSLPDTLVCQEYLCRRASEASRLRCVGGEPSPVQEGHSLRQADFAHDGEGASVIPASSYAVGEARGEKGAVVTAESSCTATITGYGAPWRSTTNSSLQRGSREKQQCPTGVARHAALASAGVCEVDTAGRTCSVLASAARSLDPRQPDIMSSSSFNRPATARTQAGMGARERTQIQHKALSELLFAPIRVQQNSRRRPKAPSRR